VSKLKFEPAVVKGIIGLVVAGLLIWGVDYTAVGEQLAATADIIGALIPLVTSLWIRQSVTPTVAVVEQVNSEGAVVAGPANELVPVGEPIRAHEVPDEFVDDHEFLA